MRTQLEELQHDNTATMHNFMKDKNFTTQFMLTLFILCTVMKSVTILIQLNVHSMFT
jgi:hypothetical protein